jgi:hypothetical protein
LQPGGHRFDPGQLHQILGPEIDCVKRIDVIAYTMALLGLAISLMQALLSGKHDPVTLLGMLGWVVGFVAIGRDLLQERKRAKSQSDVGRQM